MRYIGPFVLDRGGLIGLGHCGPIVLGRGSLIVLGHRGPIVLGCGGLIVLGRHGPIVLGHHGLFDGSLCLQCVVVELLATPAVLPTRPCGFELGLLLMGLLLPPLLLPIPARRGLMCCGASMTTLCTCLHYLWIAFGSTSSALVRCTPVLPASICTATSRTLQQLHTTLYYDDPLKYLP